MTLENAIILQEINRQPAVWQGLVQRRLEVAESVRAAVGARPVSDIYAFGCGDSYFAALAATYAFQELAEARYYPVAASEFLLYAGARTGPASVAIPISMSGNVDRTVEGAVRAVEHGARTLAITNSGSGRLKSAVSSAFLLGIQEPGSFLSGTVTYTSTIIALVLVAAASGRSAQAERARAALAELALLSEGLGSALPAIQEKIVRLVPALVQARRVYVLGTGANLATAKYGAAKFAEMTQALVVPQDLEEFAHAEYWQLAHEDVVIVLAEAGEQREYARRTVEALQGFPVPVITISLSGPEAFPGHMIEVPNTTQIWSPLVLCVPLQLLAYEWARQSGLDPNLRPHLRNDQRRFEISRKLTRQTLVGKGI